MSEIGQQIIGAVRAVAAKRPDYIHEGHCVYVLDGLPACLMGHALWDLEIINDGLYGTEMNGEGISLLLDALGIKVDDPEMDWLEATQGGQDAKSPWGDAVRIADNVDDELLASW